MVIPFIIYDKEKQQYAGSSRLGVINWKSKVLHNLDGHLDWSNIKAIVFKVS